jgi:hypothetical protein
MRTILFVIAICIATLNYAQPVCASSEYLDVQKKADPFLNGRMQSIEQSTKLTAHLTSISSINNIAGNQAGDLSAIIKIPVVVHIVYKRTEENISDEQVKSEIDALNRDYRRKNFDTVNTPARFKSVAADVQIEFVLATADPDGRATSGIVRKQCNRDSWETDDKIKYSKNGGDDAWDSHSYLNIWVGKINKVLGYSTFPGTDAAIDGVVINYIAFGTINTTSQYQLGRTTVHEVGHWLNLKHIWGDEHCGDDMVDDTPKQGYYTTGCPGGEFRTSCDNGSLGDMYMNYMDFTNEACTNLFTKGQKNRMRALFDAGGARTGILVSKGLNQPWNFTPPVVEVVKPTEDAKVTIKLFPNPAVSELTINFVDQSWTGKKLIISGINGKAENAVIITSTTQRINIAGLNPGIYFIEGFNGDQRFRQKFIKL